MFKPTRDLLVIVNIPLPPLDLSKGWSLSSGMMHHKPTLLDLLVLALVTLDCLPPWDSLLALVSLNSRRDPLIASTILEVNKFFFHLWVVEVALGDLEHPLWGFLV